MVIFQESKIYQAYYTKSEPIVNYMVNNLQIEPGNKVLEPCGGDGVFIESILDKQGLITIDVFEISNEAIDLLNNKYGTYQNVNIYQKDALLDNDLILHSDFGGKYDKIIANPPYGAWQDYDKRKKLKSFYGNLYVKETYALFLYRCIQLLNEGGILVFIIPDTFLNLHMHKNLRKEILSRTKIKELALIPSSFFPGVNFGYANLSIITLEKCSKIEECLSNKVNIIRNFNSVEELLTLPASKSVEKIELEQGNIFRNLDYAFFINNNSKVNELINSSCMRISDVADCVTGFYSGNDKLFLKTISNEIKNSKNYNIVNKDMINYEYKNFNEILDGISGNKYFIPIVKGGNVKYLKNDNWYMDWSKESVYNYKSSKKARYQNPSFYFKFGIGVPMISSSCVSASLIDNKLFDQSIVGIFPKDKKWTYYLLALFNSITCNTLIRTINPSANNPANYIKKIPFIKPSKMCLDNINFLITKILKEIRLTSIYDKSLEYELNDIIKSIYDF